MKKILLLIFILTYSICNAQDALAKIEFAAAETEYQAGNYAKSLEHLETVKKMLGSTNSTVMYLEIMDRHSIHKENSLPVSSSITNIIRIKDLTSQYVVDFQENVPIIKLTKIYKISQEFEPAGIAMENFRNAEAYFAAADLESANRSLKSACSSGNSFACDLINLADLESNELVKIKNYAAEQKDIFNWEEHSNLKSFHINGKYLFLNNEGKVLIRLRKNISIPSIYTEFVNDRLMFLDEEISRYGFLNPNGDVAIPAKYRGAQPFLHGEAHVKDESSKWTFIDINGSEITKTYTVFHIVQKRETLLTIAEKYGVTPTHLMLINGGSVVLTKGQKLKIK